MYPYTLFWDVTLYDILLLIGVLAALGVFLLYSKLLKLDDGVRALVFISAAVAIGAGIFFAVLTQSVYDYIATGVFELGGMTFLGGLVFGAAAFFGAYFAIGRFMFRKPEERGLHIRSLPAVVNIAACCIAVAHGIGRLGCFTAGCCHGAVYNEPTPFTVPRLVVSKSGELIRTEYMIPLQIYESAFLFVLFAVLTVTLFKKPGYELPTYMAAYGIWRFVLEFMRADERGATIVPFMSPSQLTSVLLVIGAAAVAVAFCRLYKRRAVYKDKEKDA